MSQHSYLGVNCASKLAIQFEEVRYEPSSQCGSRTGVEETFTWRCGSIFEFTWCHLLLFCYSIGLSWKKTGSFEDAPSSSLRGEDNYHRKLIVLGLMGPRWKNPVTETHLPQSPTCYEWQSMHLWQLCGRVCGQHERKINSLSVLLQFWMPNF